MTALQDDPEDQLCMGKPCGCQIQREEAEMARRKKITSLSYLDSDDTNGEESRVFDHASRSGDIEMFLLTNPEYLLIKQETREEEIEVARELYRNILVDLTDRQKEILRLRSEGKTFKEVWEAVGICERSGFYDWKSIREVAYKSKSIAIGEVERVRKRKSEE